MAIRDGDLFRRQSDDSIGSVGPEIKSPPSSPVQKSAPEFSNDFFERATHAQLHAHLQNNADTSVDQLRRIRDRAQTRAKEKMFGGKAGLEKILSTPQMKALDTLDKMTEALGSGVRIPPDIEEAFMKAAIAYPNLVDDIQKMMNAKDPDSFLETMQNSFSELNNSIEPEKFKELSTPLKNLLMDLRAKLHPEAFNQQYANEYLPRQWMSKEDQEADGDLNREGGPVNNFEKHLQQLAPTDPSAPQDPRFKEYGALMASAELAGFKRGESYNIALPTETSAARLYGIRRTDKGFESILGLALGDKSIAGVDRMPWKHETNDAQNAAMMKILRQMEKKPWTPEEFEQAYKAHAGPPENPILKPQQKQELLDALKKFSAERKERIQSQLQALGFGNSS